MERLTRPIQTGLVQEVVSYTRVHSRRTYERGSIERAKESLLGVLYKTKPVYPNCIKDQTETDIVIRKANEGLSHHMTQEPLFEGVDPLPEFLGKKPGAVEKIALMHRRHGKAEGKICGDCIFLRVKTYSKNYYKCKKYGITGGAATDWQLRFPACGLFFTDNEGE